MATSTRSGAARAAPQGPAADPLPTISVARFKEATRLVERLVSEKADVFLAAQQSYRERHALAHPERQLTAPEAAQIAAAMLGTRGADDSDVDPVALISEIQASDLRTQDRPASQEMLMVAGAATAPEFVDAGLRLLALLRIPDDEFKRARKAGNLDRTVEVEVEKLDDLDAREAWALARQALEHYGVAAGAEGNALGLLTRIVREAQALAMGTMGPTLDRLTSSSLTGSPPSTDGASTASSTTPPGPTP